MAFRNICVLVLCTKIALALEVLIPRQLLCMLARYSSINPFISKVTWKVLSGSQVSAPGDLSSSHEVGPVGVLWAKKSSPKR